MEPFSMFMAAASAGMKIAGGLGKGKSDAAILNQQAAFYDRQAEFETIKSEYDVARHRDATDRVLATQRNRYLGMGFSLDGTPSDVAFDSISESEKDVYAIRFGAAIRSENFRAEAQNKRAGAAATRSASIVNAITTGLDWAGSTNGKSTINAGLKLGQSLFSGG